LEPKDPRGLLRTRNRHLHFRNIPNLSDEFKEADHWVANHFLNAVLGGGFAVPYKQYALNFLFRTRAAFRAYHYARDATLDYLKTSPTGQPRTRLYLDAIGHRETVLLNLAVCIRIVNTMDRRIFDPGDGSSEERAYTLSNDVKHWAEGNRFEQGDTLPMWLTDDGLVSRRTSLSYEELGDLVRDAARLADELQSPATGEARSRCCSRPTVATEPRNSRLQPTAFAGG
jgi:hypothetical protein